MVALPWVFGDVPDLNGVEYPIPQDADGVYLHDLAVRPSARRIGAAGRLLNAVLEAAKANGYDRVFLVASPGFRLTGSAAYGEGATYMARFLIRA